MTRDCGAWEREQVVCRKFERKQEEEEEVAITWTDDIARELGEARRDGRTLEEACDLVLGDPTRRNAAQVRIVKGKRDGDSFWRVYEAAMGSAAEEVGMDADNQEEVQETPVDAPGIDRVVDHVDIALARMHTTISSIGAALARLDAERSAREAKLLSVIRTLVEVI